VPRRTLIRAGHIIAFDGRGHWLLRDGVVVVEDDRILHVGRRFEGAVDETAEARDRVVTPGLIATHAHLGGSPLDRSFIEDRGNPQFFYSGLYDMLAARSGAQDDAAARACIDFSLVELLCGGVTTVLEIGGEAAVMSGPKTPRRGAGGCPPRNRVFCGLPKRMTLMPWPVGWSDAPIEGASSAEGTPLPPASGSPRPVA